MGSRHTKPKTTLSLIACAPALIDCPAHPARHGGPAEVPVGEASELSGQRDGASGQPALSSAGGGAHQVKRGALVPGRVMHGTVVPGELADNHKTARSEGNIRREAFND